MHEAYHTFGGDSEHDMLYVAVVVLGLLLLATLYMNTPENQSVFMLVVDNYDPADARVKRRANFYCLAFWGLLLAVGLWAMCPGMSRAVQGQ